MILSKNVDYKCKKGDLNSYFYYTQQKKNNTNSIREKVLTYNLDKILDLVSKIKPCVQRSV